MASTTTTPQIPKTMKGVLVEKTGGPEVLQYRTDLPVPEAKDGQILIKNDLIGINYIDTYFRTGLYPSPKPEILGREAEGIILSIPSSTPNPSGLAVGDRVAYIGTAAYAEYTAAPALHTVRVPASLPPGAAAASLLQGLTALTLIREAHAVQRGDLILVHAAAGGVGLWLCQLLRVLGATTIGTASTAEKCALATANGASFTIDYSRENVVERVKQLTDGRGVIAVFDGVGKDTFEEDFEVLSRKGSLVSFGNASGAVPPVTIARLAGKNLKLLRPTLFNYIATEEEFGKYTAELFGTIAERGLETHVHEVYPLEEVGRAHTDLEGRKTRGKLLLRP